MFTLFSYNTLTYSNELFNSKVIFISCGSKLVTSIFKNVIYIECQNTISFSIHHTSITYSTLSNMRPFPAYLIWISSNPLRLLALPQCLSFFRICFRCKQYPVFSSEVYYEYNTQWPIPKTFIHPNVMME